MDRSDKGFLAAYTLRKNLAIEMTNPIDLSTIVDKLAIKLVYRDLGRGVEGACISKGKRSFRPHVEHSGIEPKTAVLPDILNH